MTAFKSIVHVQLNTAISYVQTATQNKIKQRTVSIQCKLGMASDPQSASAEVVQDARGADDADDEVQVEAMDDDDSDSDYSISESGSEDDIQSDEERPGSRPEADLSAENPDEEPKYIIFQSKLKELFEVFHMWIHD